MALLPHQLLSYPSTESEYYDEPPTYAVSVYSCRSVDPSPSYSVSPRHSEQIIRVSSEATCASERHFVYRSKHITVNLGPKLWSMSMPVYGGGASIEGSFSLSADVKNITSVHVKLEGIVTNLYSERGQTTGSSCVEVLSTSLSLTEPISGDWTDHQLFSMGLPTTSLRRRSPLPPSSILHLSGITCTVKYRLKVKVVRKGFHRNHNIKVPLLYLPRTFARGPLLSCISDVAGSSGAADDIPEVRRIPLKATSKTRSASNAPAIILTVPSTLSFASYDTIPMTLSIISSQDPAVAKLLLSSTKIHLIKRTRIWINGGRSSSESESLVGNARVVNHGGDRGGESTIFYELCVERPAAQKTWVVEGVVEQRYYIHATIKPPKSAAAHIPSYECEQPIELTTDPFESHEREIVVSGGTASPAIGTLGVGLPGGNTEVATLALGIFR